MSGGSGGQGRGVGGCGLRERGNASSFLFSEEHRLQSRWIGRSVCGDYLLRV